MRQILQLQWKQHQQYRSVSRVDGESYDRSIGEQRYNTYNSSSVIDRKLLKNSTHRGESVLWQTWTAVDGQGRNKRKLYKRCRMEMPNKQVNAKIHE